MEDTKFYELDHGWANKYFWFNITESFGPGTPTWEYLIKNKKLTFSKQSGTTPADIHGSTMAICFYSQRFIDLLRDNGITNFSMFKIKFVSEMGNLEKYYFIEPNNYPVSHFKKKNIKKYVKKNPASRKSLFKLEDGTTTAEETLFDFSKYDDSDFFGVNDTRFIFVTKKLKEIIEKAKLKNVQFVKIISVPK